MDKSWMTKPRGTNESRDGCRLFVDFTVRNYTLPDGKIYCPCKVCRLNRRYPLGVVLSHLTGGKGILLTYKDWMFHGEKPLRGHVEPSPSNRPATDAVGGSSDQSGNMHAMLRDVFGMHDIREDNCESQVVVQGDEEIVVEEADEVDVRKYHKLLKEAKTLLYDRTKHSKLSATIHMYNLKCVGGISKKIFSSLLEFINQLLPADDGAFPVNTYEAKKYLRDMRLGYEKIPASRNDCMLFWKGNKELDSCTVCEKSKWKDEIHLDEDGQPISSSKKHPVKVLRWFPLIPRLQRLFMSQYTLPHMKWHADNHTKEGILRHPADNEA
ncbi:uncharacterized protein LOC132190807 [Corylus avellana]|uniref:uncharacterized protein LOC132190807 n=1 Tax=Corylus avellana TaxID=13451 RepID=UPI00286D3F57|nr:uncharacterized protein LOC132190807 [Corylus avellana]